MDMNTWNELKRQKVVVTNKRKQTDKVFKACGGYALNIAGVFETEIKIGNKTGMCMSSM